MCSFTQVGICFVLKSTSVAARTTKVAAFDGCQP